MKTWSKPTLVVSKCLNKNNCRYDGQSSPCNILESLKPFVKIIEVCPEEAIGLTTPRSPIRLINSNSKIQLIDPKTLCDYTQNMTEFSEEFLDSIPRDTTGFLLKSRSPSCGIKDVKIYSSSKKGGKSTRGSGIFGSLVINKFEKFIVEEDGRIKNFAIRDHFLTKLFILSNFNDIYYSSKEISELISFHSKNKLLLKSYSQTGQKKLGRLIANHENLEIDIIYKNYKLELLNIIKKAPRYTSIINTLNHALGYFDLLSKDERDFTYEIIEKFRLGKIPLSVPKTLLMSYAIRFKNNYLLSQTFLNPYPEELFDITDSGKGVVR